MPEYVPYEERVRRQADRQAAAQEEAAETRARVTGAAARLLRDLHATTPDCYVEVLRPIGGVHRWFIRRPVFQRGREWVVIAEVVDVYRFSGVILPNRIKTELVTSQLSWLDAYVTTTGRWWAKEGSERAIPPNEHEREGVHQVYSRGHELSDLTKDELTKLVDRLRARKA